ncbi:MAG TPA: dTMP kinase [Caulobacter sp.]|nr:dTMP kinase [Caulobacter sp.]
MSRGKFITFEGGEGTGKSTQSRILTARLLAEGRTAIRTREPGGSDGAEALRSLLVEGRADRWSPLSETLMMNAARRDHLERTIVPALDAGDWVVCDRFADSTRAYQGAGGGVPAEFIATVERAVVGDNCPDLTLVFDLPPEIGLERAFGRDMFEVRFETKDFAFHTRLREAYLGIARAEPERCVVIDASGTEDQVADLVWNTVMDRLGR